MSSITQGGVNAQVEASVLSLYDQERLKGPLKNGVSANWADIDKEIMDQLNAISAAGGSIKIISSPVNILTTPDAFEALEVSILLICTLA